MLRRLIASSCRRTLPTSTARAPVGPILCISVASHRSITTDATRAASDAARERNASGSNNSSSSQRRPPLPPLSPAFDIVHWNDADVAAGHLVRVIYRDSHIVLEYHRQTRRIMDDDGRRIDGDGRGNAERLVTLTLPPVYIARFLGVLEGRMSEVEVQSRFTNATFKPDTSTAKAHHYILRCVSHRPTTGQRQTAEGVDVAEDSVEWQVSLDAAESLMLHRFLTQALKYNSGFGRQR
ncbi:unnamed protein product [Phytomonas sp. EM1]|nr:unnamed protein product [Phytomonas sp. EM1]|eukprot:CCW64591.1 unnamed protein product [Phytomonas sp. isolate EM1]